MKVCMFVSLCSWFILRSVAVLFIIVLNKEKHTIYIGSKYCHVLVCVMQYEAIQVRSTSLIIYKAYSSIRSRSHIERERLKLQLRKSKKYSGEVSQSSKKNITKAIELLVMSSPKRKVFNKVIQKDVDFSLSFITLTIPDLSPNLTPKYCYDNLLKKLLRKYNQKQPDLKYVWKMEYQVRGNIHYHITSNMFIDHEELRKDWNRIIEDAGLMDVYKQKNGNNNPNSTDIKSVKKVKDMAAYLVKYCTKKVSKHGNKSQSELSEVPTMSGKIWGCSKSLQGKSLLSLPMVYENVERVEYACRKRLAKVIETEFCTIIKAKNIKVSALLTMSQISEWNEYQKNDFTIKPPPICTVTKSLPMKDLHTLMPIQVKQLYLNLGENLDMI